MLQERNGELKSESAPVDEYPLFTFYLSECRTFFHELWPGCCLLEVLAGEVIFSKRSMVTTLHRGGSLSSTPTPHFAGIVGLTVIRVKRDQT